MVKRQKLIGIIASVVLAGLGTGLLVAYVRGAEGRAVKGEKRASVLVVTDTIPKGTRAEDITGKVKTEQVPTKVVAKGALATIGPITGRVSAVDLLPGEQVVQTRFALPGEASTKTVAPPGSLQVTVALDAVRALGGRLREGDSVGVLMSFDDPQTTHLVLQKVPVTDVRTAEGAPVTTKIDGPAPTGSFLVTLAVDVASVEKVVFAAEHGRLWLSWEPKDANEGGAKVQTKNGVNL
ncbi:MAG: Flp pilus assembly protein CpaB [Actinomycetota bacterium]|nr:Flp pilus assembly protein CpaB [Actinomycetota bacterium]